MDWSQASMLEVIAFCIGSGVITAFLMTAIIVLVQCVGYWGSRVVRRIRRMKKTTRALRCDVCEYNVADGFLRRCEFFDVSISCAPVNLPGCSWGIERKGDQE